METYILVFILGILVGFLAYRAKVLQTKIGSLIVTEEDGRKYAYVQFNKDPNGYTKSVTGIIEIKVSKHAK